jgi:tetratricopeptide (TPR) repeat protein
VLERDPDHVSALTNLVNLLQREDRQADAEPLRERLAYLQPHPPFHYFELGRQAMERGDFARARQLFARELRSQPNQDEVHFWAARADLALGDAAGAADHLRLAIENSPNRGTHDRYATKLDHLRASRLQ